MTLVWFDLATPADDPALRRILRTAMPGTIALSFEREPCYFQAAALEGPFHQTMVGRASCDGAVVGMGSRGVRLRMVNGKPMPVGAMSLLRVDPAFAWGAALPKVLSAGFGFYRQLHADGRTPFYLVSILEGNRAAERLLAAGLPGWPRLRPLGRWLTFALPVGRPRPIPPLPPGWQLEPARPEWLGEIADCLARAAAQRQLAPLWQPGDLASPAHTPGLSIEDFWVVRRGDEVAGCAARWDQQAYKQTVVRGYSRALRWARPLVNLQARLRGAPPLPPVGGRVRHTFLSCLAVAPGDPAWARQASAALLAAVYNAASAAGDHYLMVGLADGDPLAAHLTRVYRPILLPSRLYLAHWEDGASAAAAVDGRPLGVEVALL
ncbi:MAG TPA: hypothetical protein VNK95_03075 [Caldilineaceae bacterium]|nr:hypothetical protein [Caldilineaceae bacterium]